MVYNYILYLYYIVVVGNDNIKNIIKNIHIISWVDWSHLFPTCQRLNGITPFLCQLKYYSTWFLFIVFKLIKELLTKYFCKLCWDGKPQHEKYQFLDDRNDTVNKLCSSYLYRVIDVTTMEKVFYIFRSLNFLYCP